MHAINRADKQTGQPNARLVLDEIELTEIAGRQLAAPCPAQVVLRFSPRLDCRIDAEKLPKFLIGLKEEMFSAATSKGIRTQVILVRNWREQMKAGNTFRGSLVCCPANNFT